MKFLIGTTVYFLSANSYEVGLFRGEICSNPEYYEEIDRAICTIKNVEDLSMPEYNCIGEYKAWTTECFATEDELRKYVKSRHDDSVKAYCSEIKSVEDLLMFPFKHAFNAEEYSNYEAAEAYVIRAKELLGVEIKPY